MAPRSCRPHIQHGFMRFSRPRDFFGICCATVSVLDAVPRSTKETSTANATPFGWKLPRAGHVEPKNDQLSICF